MTEVYNFDNFQIPHSGFDGNVFTENVRSDSSNRVEYSADSKISNFSALKVGSRNSNDYTKLSKGFKSKDELSAIDAVTEDTGVGVNLRGTSIDDNPYVDGSTVKHVNDDQFTVMGRYKDNGTEITSPGKDVMDNDEALASGITSVTNYESKNWPSEGWRSFGGKNDFHV